MDKQIKSSMLKCSTIYIVIRDNTNNMSAQSQVTTQNTFFSVMATRELEDKLVQRRLVALIGHPI